MSDIRRIAIDPGFGGYKVASATGERTLSRVIPSLVGIGQADDLGLGDNLVTGDDLAVADSRRPLEVSFLNGASEAVDCLVGRGVERYVRPIQRTDFDMLSGAWEQRALTYAALYRLLGAGEHRVWLLAALPIQAMRDVAVRGRLAAWLGGRHEFRVGRRRAAVEVERVAAAPQPLGAYFAWGLDDAGRWARDAKDAQRRVGVIDLGFNTLDLLVLEGGRPVRRYTGGDQLGVSRAAARLVSEVQRRYHRRLDLHEADDLLRAAAGGGEAETGGVDVGALARGALAQWVGEVVDYLNAQWGAEPNLAATLVTGGGALAAGAQLAARWPGATVLRDPVTANARGLARYARRDAIWQGV